MNKYQCYNCERSFDEPIIKETTYEKHLGLMCDTNTPLELELCPYCGSEEVVLDRSDEDETY